MDHRLRARALVALCAAALLALGLATVAAQPSIPATFYGSASIDGQPVPDGTEVRGFVDGKDCTQPPPGGNKGTVRAGDASEYVITVMHESQAEGCGADGKTITFKIGDRDAAQTAPWKTGPLHLDLNAGSGKPVPLPTASAQAPDAAQTLGPTQAAATATESAKFTPRPAGTPPTDDVQLNRTPSPSGTAVDGKSSDSNGSGISPLLILLIVVVAVGVAGEGTVLALRRRSRKPPPGPPLPPSEE
jgi:hypothetical protein